MPERNEPLIADLDARVAACLAAVPGSRLVVGVSGGVDSMLLLELARRQGGGRPPLLALHVHHGLSPRADAWAAHVEAHCATRGVACRVLRVAVDAGRPSRESAARDARHAALAQSLAPGDALLLAHHADDQAETLLLRLLRGSGLSGLAAMRPVRGLPAPDGCQLLRPLLDVPRADIERAATALGLSWVEDESNADTAFDRNFLRHEILPRLHLRWPAVGRTLAATARRLAEADDLLCTYLDADLAPLLGPDEPGGPSLDVTGLLARPVPVQRALVRRWLARLGAPVFSEAWLDQVLAVAAARVDAEGELRVAGWEVHRFRGHLHAFAQLPDPGPGRVLAWTGAGSLDLAAGHGRLEALPPGAGDGLALALPPDMPLAVRFREGGERLSPAGGAGSRPLKKVLQDLDLPPWLRHRVPLLFAGDALVAVGDRVADAAFAPAPGRPATLRLRWHRPRSAPPPVDAQPPA